MSSKNQPFFILFQDAFLLVVDKPSGISVIPERVETDKGNLKSSLEKSLGIELWTVHRIDRDTSGLVLFAKSAEAHKAMNDLFENRKIEKHYWALVSGKMEGKSGEIDSPIAHHPAKNGKMIIHPKGKEALTLFDVVEQFKHTTLLNVEIKTGRTHQIRVHFSETGYPLLVDPIYGSAKGFQLSSVKKKYKQTDEEERPILNRLPLHAYSLKFEHPFTKKEIAVESPMPKDIETCLKLLRKYDS
ncbi:MAG TPA: RluA family pseudouridine synthase [Chitinophagales bacterium]